MTITFLNDKLESEMTLFSLPASLQLQLKACRTLPSVPAVVLEVLDICRDEDISISQVAKVLIRDPARCTY